MLSFGSSTVSLTEEFRTSFVAQGAAPMNVTARWVRCGIIVIIALLSASFGLNLLQAQPGRTPSMPRPYVPPPQPTPRPYVPPTPTPTPRPYIPPTPTPQVPGPTPRPYIPPVPNTRPIVPSPTPPPLVVQHVWICSNCRNVVG